MPSMHGTRLSKNRHNMIPTWTYKTFPWMDLGDFHASHSMTAWCSTFLPCSPTIRLKGKVLPHKRAQETPPHQHTSLCAVCGATQLLHCATTMLVPHSPIAKPNITPANALFTGADLVSHVLRMCPLTRQNHFNLHKKGMAPVEMHLLVMSLKAIEHVCTQEMSNARSSKKASNKGKKGNTPPGTEPTARVPKKAHCTEKHCNLCLCWAC